MRKIAQINNLKAASMKKFSGEKGKPMQTKRENVGKLSVPSVNVLACN